jgi:alkylation response protein AidB-like acyl-CoA dehydrogenase
MITEFNSDLKPFEELAISFAAKELKKNVVEHDRYPFGEFFFGVLGKAYEVGLLGITLSEEFGGSGQGISALCTILDHICQVDSSLGGIIFTNALSQEIMLQAGANDLLATIFTNAGTAQEALVAYPSFSSPGQAAVMPTATPAGKDYSLSGEIEYLVLGNIASRAIIPARIANTDGYTFFLVDLSGNGVKKGAPIFSLGLHACPAVDVTFDKAQAILLGAEGKGDSYFDASSRKLHVATGAMQTGIMKGSFNEALAYAKERFQGGREIINWSEVSMYLGNMAVKTKVAELSVAHACRAIEANTKDWGHFSIACALHLHELSCELVNDGVQLLGGNGYMKDYGQEKRYRDARQVQAFMGAAPLKKMALIKELAN